MECMGQTLAQGCSACKSFLGWLGTDPTSAGRVGSPTERGGGGQWESLSRQLALGVKTTRWMFDAWLM